MGRITWLRLDLCLEVWPKESEWQCKLGTHESARKTRENLRILGLETNIICVCKCDGAHH